MATIKINELGAGTPVSTDLVPFADPTTGLAEKATITQIATLIQPLLTGKADLNGDSTETFEVADATSSTEAVNKGQLDVAINALQGALIPQGNWDASTNTPDITGTTATGYYWIVSVDGSTPLDGITDWKVNDWAVKTATGWAKIDNSLPTTLAYTNVDNNFSAVQTFDSRIRINSEGSPPNYYEIKSDSQNLAFVGTGGGYFNIAQNNGISYSNANGSGFKINPTNITPTTTRVFDLPDASGTIALTSDIDNITLQDLSLSQSLLESWARTREAAGDTYFPNEGAYSLALDKYLGIKPVIDLIPSAINTNVIRVYNKDTSKDLTSSRTSTATYVDQFGEIETAATGVPRIDWTNGVGELLLEPQSTNLIDYSEDFSLWSLNGDSVVNTGTTAFGKSIWRITESSTTDLGVVKNYTATGLVDTTISVLVKADTSNTLLLRYGASNNKNLEVNLSDGSVTSSDVGVTSSVKDMGNGWYLVASTITLVNTSVDFAIYTNNGAIDIIYAQAEALSYPTSYIRTSGSQVTRIADAVTGNASLGQVINSSEGVLYFEMSALADDLTQRYISLSDGTFNNIVSIRYHSVSNTIRVICISSGVTQLASSYALTDITDKSKFALKYKENDFALWVDGVEVLTDTSGSTFSANTLDKLTFEDGSSNNPFYGRIRELKVYDTALTDAELTTLTTI